MFLAVSYHMATLFRKHALPLRSFLLSLPSVHHILDAPSLALGYKLTAVSRTQKPVFKRVATESPADSIILVVSKTSYHHG